MSTHLGHNIRLTVLAHDSNLVSCTTEQILKAVQSSGSQVIAAVALPNRRKIITVNRGPHIDKHSREQFAIITYKRMLEFSNNPQVRKALNVLPVPNNVKIKWSVT